MESSVITPTPITTPLSNATTLNNGTELVQPELASTEELDNASQAEERMNDEYGDGNMYESEIDEPVNVTDQPDFAPPPTIDTSANVEPRPTADATRQGKAGSFLNPDFYIRILITHQFCTFILWFISSAIYAITFKFKLWFDRAFFEQVRAHCQVYLLDWPALFMLP